MKKYIFKLSRERELYFLSDYNFNHAKYEIICEIESGNNKQPGLLIRELHGRRFYCHYLKGMVINLDQQSVVAGLRGSECPPRIKVPRNRVAPFPSSPM